MRDETRPPAATGGEPEPLARLMAQIERVVDEIETIKQERRAEPTWAARVRLAAVYFKRRLAGDDAQAA